jgi:hypothetical protein
MPGLSGDEVVAHLPAEQFVLVWSTDHYDLPDRCNGTLSKPISVASAQNALARATAWRERTAARCLPPKPAVAARRWSSLAPV